MIVTLARSASALNKDVRLVAASSGKAVVAREEHADRTESWVRAEVVLTLMKPPRFQGYFEEYRRNISILDVVLIR
jgi:hypothetical protein